MKRILVLLLATLAVATDAQVQAQTNWPIFKKEQHDAFQRNGFLIISGFLLGPLR
jgi:hypothetical protein